MEHPTHALKNDLGQVKSHPKTSSCSRSGARKRGRPGSHLYLKSNVYYFRYVFDGSEVARVGRSEIRLSLRTGYLRKAKWLSGRIYFELMSLINEKPMLDYLEIRRRINNCLIKMLAEDDMDIGERSPKNFVGKQIPPADYSAEVARVLQLNDNNPEELMNVAPLIAEDDMDVGERLSKNFAGKQVSPADYSAEVVRVLQLSDNNPEELVNFAPMIAEDLIKV